MSNVLKFKLKQEDMPSERSYITLDALTRKASKIRSNKDRKPNEAKNKWRKENYDEE